MITNLKIANLSLVICIALALALPSLGCGDSEREGSNPVTGEPSNPVTGEPSNPVVSEASPPVITAGPQSQQVMVGEQVLFSVVASGDPEPEFRWYKDGVAIAGATDSEYAIDPVLPTDAGTYTVTVFNSEGSVESDEALLTVDLPSEPLIIAWPQSQQAIVGEKVVFSVVAFADPAPEYVWHKDGVAIDEATEDEFVIDSVELSDAGIYTVTVSNSEGSFESDEALLTVELPAVPMITVQPQSRLTVVGQRMVFSVVALADPAPEYLWHKDGVAIEEATEDEFIIDAVELSDAATYTVTVSNTHGSITSDEALLTVEPPSDTSFVEGNTLVDMRDGSHYAIVTIGTQTWMAENLNIGEFVRSYWGSGGSLSMSRDNDIIEKYAYDNNIANWDVYGGLYEWGEAMNYSSNSRGICPEGWHIPSNQEWKTLETYLGIDPSEIDETGWRGTDQGTQLIQGGETGFNALFSGTRSEWGSFNSKDTGTTFWTSTKHHNDFRQAWARSLSANREGISLHSGHIWRGHSVRCIMD